MAAKKVTFDQVEMSKTFTLTKSLFVIAFEGPKNTFNTQKVHLSKKN